jgi:hypothetical protein
MAYGPIATARPAQEPQLAALPLNRETTALSEPALPG